MADEGGYDDLWFENLPCLDLSIFDEDNDGNQSIETAKTSKETQSADLTPQSSRTSTGKRDRSDFETDLSNAVPAEVPIHVLNERERRKKMNEKYAHLHALLPQAHVKLLKGDLVEAAVNYIKTLKDILQQLEQRKQEKERLASLTTMDPSSSSSSSPFRNTVEQFIPNDQGPSNASRSSFNSLSFRALVSSDVFLNVCEGEAQYNVQSPKKLGTLSTILSVLEKYLIRVLYVNVSSKSGMTYYYIRALAGEVHADTLMATLTVEDRYRQSAFEISQWIEQN